MDKIKPIIEHHFWILFGLVLILPSIGWWPATGQFSKETEEQTGKIESAFSQVPSGPKPNDSWKQKLDQICVSAEGHNEEARVQLWNRQLDMMKWPSQLRSSFIPAEYRGDFSAIARNIYRNIYNREVLSTFKQIDPFDAESGKGTVLIELSAIPIETFGNLTPDTEKMWDSQEDMWLYANLFRSIRRLNQDATIVTESAIRQVKQLNLLGGEGDYPDAPASEGGEEEYYEEEFFDEDMGMDMEGGGGLTITAAGSASFDPSEELGTEQGRWVDYKESLPYKKRGFYLEAVIDHRRFPEIMAGLTNSDWPVTILRAQMKSAASDSLQIVNEGSGSLFDNMDPGLEQFPEDDFGSITSIPGFPSTSKSTEHADLAQAAISGPFLAEVAIAGVIYVYNQPPELLEPEETAGDNQTDEMTDEETTLESDDSTTNDNPEVNGDIAPAANSTETEIDPETTSTPDTPTSDTATPSTELEEITQ